MVQSSIYSNSLDHSLPSLFMSGQCFPSNMFKVLHMFVNGGEFSVFVSQEDCWWVIANDEFHSGLFSILHVVGYCG